MKKVLVAGATGYLGRFVVQELKKQGYYVKVLAREKSRLNNLREYIDEEHIGQITDPSSITGICKEIDYVFSAIGITRQKDGLTYQDVDYQGNLNLLKEAMRQNVSKFIYVSVLNGERLGNLAGCRAKENFVAELKKSGLDYCIIRPNGFFSDMKDFLKMAEKGNVYLFGDGKLRINPIHGADLARVCVDSIIADEKEINVGGPDILTQNEIAALALNSANKKGNIIHLPDWIRKLALSIMRRCTSSKTYGPVEFFLSVMAIEMVAPIHGRCHLKDFFAKTLKIDKI